MKIAISGKRRISAEQASEIGRFLNVLLAAIPDVLLVVNERYRAVVMPLLDSVEPKNWHEDTSLKGCDIALSIGGDGTFLRTARWIGGHEIPILGINSGHLGYLTDLTLEEAPAIVSKIAALDFDVESRSLLAVEVKGDDIPQVAYPFALNEVAVLRDDSAGIIAVDTMLDTLPLATYHADGLIISTPTGSTGYNLSVGGPILSPNAGNFVLSPVAPHSLTMRPLVVCDSSTIDISVQARSGSFCLALDGRSLTLPATATLRITRAPFVTRVMLRRSHNFAETLRNKLLWGLDAR